MNLKAYEMMISGSKGLHNGSGAEKGEMVAVTTFHSNCIHHPLAWNSNLQPSESLVTTPDQGVIGSSFHPLVSLALIFPIMCIFFSPILSRAGNSVESHVAFPKDCNSK